MARTAGRGHKFEWKGLDAVVRKLNQLPDDVGRAILKTGLHDALEPMLFAARREVPVDSGATYEAITITPTKSKKGRLFAMVRVGRGDFQGDEFYASFNLYGFERNGILYPPDNWMARAFDQSHEETRARAAKLISAAVESAWKA